METPALSALPSDPHRIEIGSSVGPYRLVEVLGEGGFGVVYRAEQQAPVAREVALKILKAGMESQQVVQRFELERQTLARMDHPHIARIFDAGVGPAGRLYFAMELVRGAPLTEYCDQACLSTRERIELMRKICAAVQHAHTKGVIHRDLKPSNVLVSEIDGVAVPKVIDFGIAKALEGERSADQALTLEHQMVGTPDYMAPEQAAGELDIDTRADVYSLGVLLYELLTGSLPYDLRRALEQSYRELLRHVCEVTPPKPSTRVIGRDPSQWTSAAKRGSTPQHLSRALRGELDWIAMRALEKDRLRRYESASALADDLERHLRGEAVSAGPPSWRYRARKFAGRHRLALSAALFALVSFAGGVGVLLWAFLSVQTERDRADEQAAHARGVSRFLTELLETTSPELASGSERSVRELLAYGVRGIEELRDQPEVQAALRNTIGGVLLELGEYDLATPLIQDAATYYRAEEDEDHDARVRSLHQLSMLLDHGLNDPVAAEGVAREALALVYQRSEHTFEAEVQNTLATSLWHQGRIDEAKEIFRAALKKTEAERGADHPVVLSLLTNLGSQHLMAGEWEEAEAIYRRVYEMESVAENADHNFSFGTTLHLLALVAKQRHDFAEAEALEHRSLAIRERVLGEEHWHVALSLNTLGSIYLQTDRAAEAVPLLRRAVDISTKTWSSHPDRWSCERVLANALTATGAYAEALALIDRQAVQLRALGESFVLALGLQIRVAILHAQGSYQEAEKSAREALELFADQVSERFPERVETVRLLSLVLKALGQDEEAEHWALEAEALAK